MRTSPFYFVLLIMLFCGCNSQSEKKEATQTIAENKAPRVVTADIEEGIKANIAKRVEEGGGYFVLDTLQLKLVRVHTEYLSNLGPQYHFACVDLADVSGDVYDVDFFLRGDPGNMVVTETTLHKLNGKPFYSWKQRKDKTWHRVPIKGASNDLLGVVQGEDHFEFKYEVTLPDMQESGSMWIPLPQSDAFQTIHLVSEISPIPYSTLQEQEFGNSIMHFELTPEDSGKKFEFVYDVMREEKNAYTDNSSPTDYLNASLLMPVGDRFSILADSIIAIKESKGALMQARALYDYIIDNMKYAKFEKYGTGDSVYACDALTGNCTEFHSLFISLARSADIPARFAIGAAIPSDRDAGGIDGYHCWAEFYADGKWWPVDISEGNKYTALATYYFGRHPANRIEFTRGRDLVLDPGPTTGTINFMAYPVLEIGNTPAVADTFFSFERKTD